MEKLEEMHEIIEQLLDSHHSVLAQYPDWIDTSDDILRMLRDVQSYCSRACLLTPPTTASSSCSTHSDLSADDYLAQATNAFNRQIYARCVQIVEAAQQNEHHIHISLTKLAHQSYMAMVENADSVTDATKIALWWRTFLEEAEKDCQQSDDLVTIMEFRVLALEKLNQLVVDSDDRILMEIIRTNEIIYKELCLRYRAFHPKTLRRLEKLQKCLEETEHLHEDVTHSTRESLSEWVADSLSDKTSYDNEIKRRNNQPYSDYNMCVLILRALTNESTRNSIYNTQIYTKDVNKEECEADIQHWERDTSESRGTDDNIVLRL